MKTLTVTKARANLGHWVKRAVAGEEIGIVIGAKLVALRPVPIEAGDYAEQQYGLTSEELDRVAARRTEQARETIRRGDYLTAEQYTHALKSPDRKATGKSRRKTAKV